VINLYVYGTTTKYAHKRRVAYSYKLAYLSPHPALETKMRNTVRVNGHRIRALREKLNGSQDWLAITLGVDVGTVSRWERGKITSVKRTVLGKLREHLHATDEDICGDGPPVESATAPMAPRGQMNVTIDTASRNALSLMADRYGVTRQQIIEVAPLLFFIAAEKSLQRRRERFASLRAQVDAVREAQIGEAVSRLGGDGLRQLRDEIGGMLHMAEVAQCWLAQEEALVENCDLLSSPSGKYDGALEADYFFLHCLEENQFADDLQASMKDVRPAAEPVTWGRRHDRPNNRFCAEEAANLVGGNQEAIERILSGAVALHEMPNDVRKSSSTKRAEWVLSESRAVGDLPWDEPLRGEPVSTLDLL
jgi:transcriptional regulator with XRE-family HTH domain